MRRLTFAALFLSAVRLLPAGPASADPIEAAAGRAAGDVWRRIASLQAEVSTVDADRRRVCFSGFPAGIFDTDARILLYRKSAVTGGGDADGIPWVEFGAGRVSAADGQTVCASVSRDILRRMPKDCVGRPDPQTIPLRLDPFPWKSPDASGPGAPATIFRHLILYEFRARGGDLEDSTVGSGITLGGLLEKTSETAVLAALSLTADGGAESLFSGNYVIDVDPAFFLADLDASPLSGQNSREGSETDAAAHPSAGLRLSLICAPSGPNGTPGEPPRTPADRLLLNATSDLGLGIWRMDTSTPTEIVLLRRNPDAPEWPALFDTLILTVDTEPALRQAKFELGESDFYELPDADFTKYAGSVAYLDRIVRSPSPELFVLLFNLKKTPTGDLKFRMAAERAIDRRSILEVLLNRRGVLADGFAQPDDGPEHPIDRRGRGSPRRRPSHAENAFLKDYSKPIALSILIPEEDPAFAAVAEKIRADLRPLSVALSIARKPWAAYAKILQSGEYDLAIAGWTRKEPHRLWLAEHFSSPGSENISFYQSRAFDSLISGKGDESAAVETLRMDLPAVPLFWLYRYGVISPRLSGLSFSPAVLFSFESIIPSVPSPR